MTTLEKNLALNGKVFKNPKGNFIKLFRRGDWVGLRSEIQFDTVEEKSIELLSEKNRKSAPISFASDIYRYIKQGKLIEIKS